MSEQDSAEILRAACGPLRGLVAIEICSTIAGPVCSRLLGDFGADVIKIEPPEGDPVRQMGKHLRTPLCMLRPSCAISSRLPLI